MPLIMPGGLDDAGKVAGGLLDKGKALLDTGKKVGGALSGVNAIKDDAKRIAGTVTDPNTSFGEKVQGIIDAVSERAVGKPGVLLPPTSAATDDATAQNPDATPPNGARSIIAVYVDP